MQGWGREEWGEGLHTYTHIQCNMAYILTDADTSTNRMYVMEYKSLKQECVNTGMDYWNGMLAGMTTDIKGNAEVS